MQHDKAAEAGEDHATLGVEDVLELALQVLSDAGLPSSHARPVAKVIADGERDECHSHGLYRLPGCVETINSPNFRRRATPTIKETSAAVVHADAGFGFSGPAFDAALPVLVRQARSVGISMLAINNCFHFSALWPEIEAITEQGLAALAMTPSHSWVAPFSGTKPVLGTNPIAFGWPRTGKPPYVFDFATSAIARGDIALHKLADKPIPLGWGLDAEGRPTTSAEAALAGAMLTFGGHKGTALSTMVELMAGPLIGDMTSVESMEFDDGAKAAPCHGELIIAFNPSLLGGVDPAANQARAERLFQAFEDQGARLPSQRRFAARQRSEQNGIRVPRQLYQKIVALLREPR